MGERVLTQKDPPDERNIYVTNENVIKITLSGDSSLI